MPDIFHTLRKGHRLMVQIQSSWFPLVDRNPQRFMDIYTAKPEEFQTATIHIYRAAASASHLRVGVLPTK
jgi:predicted acyl esterase